MGNKMFNLKISSTDNLKEFKSLSTIIYFILIENNEKEKIKEIEKLFKIKFSKLQEKNFLVKDINEIKITRTENPEEIIIHKIKIDEKFSTDYFRNYLAGFIPTLKNTELNSLYISIPSFKPFENYFKSEDYFYQTFVEGIYYGNYTFEKYKYEKSNHKNLEVIFYSENKSVLNKAIQTAEIIMESVNFTKDLQNEPGGILTPIQLVDRIKSKLSKSEIKITVFDEKEIKRRKMGGLLAVGMGSDNPPRFIVLEYNGKLKSKKKNNEDEISTIALVGKGITFDSGGISLKPANDMWEMKGDMSGAAVVAGTILAAAKSKLKINIIGVIPSAENMPSGKSMRPGDIVITSSGKSIEVDNTDAEGRMILADALHYASQKKPDVIIDLATLTGACVVALGEFVAGIFTKNNKLSNDIFENGLKTYERVWPLPLWDDYHQLNKSEVADVKNSGSRWGSAISAAKFLENFVSKNIPWAHLDIAGPALPHNFNNYTKNYMTGFGVRLLYEFLLNKSKN